MAYEYEVDLCPRHDYEDIGPYKVIANAVVERCHRCGKVKTRLVGS